MQLFNFDRAKAQRSLTDPDAALSPVNAYTDADELDSLLQAALDSGTIARADPRARLYIYPLSLSEPDPLLAVDPGRGPTLLGHSLKLLDREGEDPVAFTLRLLDDVTAEANELSGQATVGDVEAHGRTDERSPMKRRSRLEETVDSELRCPECGSRKIAYEREAILLAGVAELRDGVLFLDGPAVPQPLDGVYLLCTECAAELPGAEWSSERPRGVPRGRRPITDAEALDALAAELNEPGECNGGDICERAADLLRCTGRGILDEPS